MNEDQRRLLLAMFVSSTIDWDSDDGSSQVNRILNAYHWMRDAAGAILGAGIDTPREVFEQAPEKLRERIKV